MSWHQGQTAIFVDPDPLACAVFIITAFIGAGALHTLWLRSRFSVRFMIPLDGYRTFRGKRIFGDNKTFRGFMVMVPAVGAVFLVLGLLHTILPAWLSRGVWPLSPSSYVLLGLWAGFGFMAGELPNSFLKRQLGIPPGAAPAHGWAKPLCFLLDRLDSIAGMMLALSWVVPIPLQTWGYVLVIGPGVHWSFSVDMFLLQVKARPA